MEEVSGEDGQELFITLHSLSDVEHTRSLSVFH